jgi:hypothetical protein
MTGARWTTAVTAAVLALGLLGCGTDEARPADGAEVGEGPADDPALLPPGTPLGDGLVVPEGARLAGTVFREEPVQSDDPSFPPPPTAVPRPPADDWTAVLVVDGDDPLAALDGLAGQARDLGFAMAGTGAACRLLLAGTNDDGGVPAPVPLADGDPGREVDHLSCSASAGDGFRSVGYEVRWGPDHTGAVVVTGAKAEAPIATSWSEVTGQGRGIDPPVPPGTPATTLPPTVAGWTIPSPEPVPAEQVAVVPERAAAEQPGPGDRFGGRANCLASGEDRLRLPVEGARLVATEAGGDGASVLAVDDIDAAFAALVDDADGDGRPTGLDVGPVEEVALADGAVARARSFSVPAGGGSCSLLADPDGAFVLIRMHSD